MRLVAVRGAELTSRVLAVGAPGSRGAVISRAYDVTVDGVSLVQNYRNTFNSQTQTNGLDELIKALASKNQTLAAEPSR